MAQGDDTEVQYAADGDGFDGYVETTVDPGPWLLLATCVFCFGVMLVVVPGLLWVFRRRRSRANEASLVDKDCEEIKQHIPSEFSIMRNVVSFDKETRKILKLAIPYTISALASSVFSNACLILVSMNVGVKPVAAYALVQVLVGLSDGILQAPIYACTTLCAQAVGSGNNDLAGNYIQLALMTYLLSQIPSIFFWWFFMHEAILFLEWGDEDIAMASQQFVRVYIFSYTFSGISGAVWQLLEVTGHAVEGTIISILWGATNVLIIGSLVRSRDNVSLSDVAWAYNASSVFYIFVTVALAAMRGWLSPFWRGLIGSTALRNMAAIKLMFKQALPLAAGSFLSNAEWAILTLLASALGPAEVAAWALLGSIWEVFYSVTGGIGDAAEIRVAFHLGNGSANGAKISAYKSLFLGMVVASTVSIFYFSVQNRIPAWFTTDETLQKMLRELVPFVGVANLTMTFGMQCWSLIGAQGKYKLATWISFVSSWGVCMPLAAIYVYIFRIDLQGMTSAVVIGYLSTGSALSFVLLNTDWRRQSHKIQEQNSDAAVGKESKETEEEQSYAALHVACSHGKTSGQRNIKLLVLPAGRRPGLDVGYLTDRDGIYVLNIDDQSPVKDCVAVGDALLSIDGLAVGHLEAAIVSGLLAEPTDHNRQLTLMAPTSDIDDSLFVDTSCMCWEDGHEEDDDHDDSPLDEAPVAIVPNTTSYQSLDNSPFDEKLDALSPNPGGVAESDVKSGQRETFPTTSDPVTCNQEVDGSQPKSEALLSKNTSDINYPPLPSAIPTSQRQDTKTSDLLLRFPDGPPSPENLHMCSSAVGGASLLDSRSRDGYDTESHVDPIISTNESSSLRKEASSDVDDGTGDSTFELV